MTEKTLIIIVAAVFGLIFAWLVVMGIASANLAARCMALGYPNSSITTGFNRYCIKRVDQTDVVAPIEKLER